MNETTTPPSIPAPFNDERAREYLRRVWGAPLHIIAQDLECLIECRDCDEIPSDYPNAPDADHVMIGNFVIIGCEGYWQINPALVGIESPNWSA
jgi:hypothetical protein